jgi:hypothetical protein
MHPDALPGDIRPSRGILGQACAYLRTTGPLLGQTLSTAAGEGARPTGSTASCEDSADSYLSRNERDKDRAPSLWELGLSCICQLARIKSAV